MFEPLHKAGIRVVDVLEEHSVPRVPQIVGDGQKILRVVDDRGGADRLTRITPRRGFYPSPGPAGAVA